MQDRKEVKYLPYNADLPQALKGKEVGQKINFKKITYEIISIEWEFDYPFHLRKN